MTFLKFTTADDQPIAILREAITAYHPSLDGGPTTEIHAGVGTEGLTVFFVTQTFAEVDAIVNP
jgi:hypothetical protein